jgi:hypothetical protein
MILKTYTYVAFTFGDGTSVAQDRRNNELGNFQDTQADVHLQLYLTDLLAQKTLMTLENVTKIALFHTVLYDNQCNTEFSPSVIQLLSALNATFCITADKIGEETRPIIETAAAMEGEMERFQNGVLRPILKQQNDRLKAQLLHYIQKRKDAYFKIPTNARAEYITHAVRKDLRFKSQLMGTIMGCFTAAEFDIFVANETELTRRMTDLLVQRLISTVV